MMVMKRPCWLFFLLIFLACEKPEPELKSQILNYPPAGMVPEIARLNPGLDFLRVKLGKQTRIAVAYAPGRDLKMDSSSTNPVKFYYGVIPSYFRKYPEPITLQILITNQGQEQVIWSGKVAPEKALGWEFAEAMLPEKSSLIIFRSDIKDYGLAITPPKPGRFAPDSRPSIIFILVDALRADHLGAYGYQRETSPNLDQLAGSGVIFMNAMTSSTFTVTSLASMFTGLYPWEHRALFAYSMILGDDLVTVAQKLREAGYQTAGFSATYFLLSDFQLERGFELFDEGCDVNFFVGDAECLTEKAGRWLDTEAESPFFLYLHYVSTHSPYHPPEEYQKLFSAGLEKPKGAVGLGDIQPFGDTRKWYQIPRAPRKNELDWLISQYDGEIRYADAEIGKLLARLNELGLRDQTLILITADHGEAFFEHKEMEHTEENHWQVTRIPLILSGPGIPGGKKIDALVRSIDLAPFLLEYAATEPLSGISGKSFSALFSGTEPDPRIGYSIKYRSEKKYQIGVVKYPDHFLIWRPADKKVELYDLITDPLEQTNLSLTRPDLYQHFYSLLPDQNLVFFGAGPKEQKLSPETQKRLKTLHYTK